MNDELPMLSLITCIKSVHRKNCTAPTSSSLLILNPVDQAPTLVFLPCILCSCIQVLSTHDHYCTVLSLISSWVKLIQPLLFYFPFVSPAFRCCQLMAPGGLLSVRSHDQEESTTGLTLGSPLLARIQGQCVCSIFTNGFGDAPVMNQTNKES